MKKLIFLLIFLPLFSSGQSYVWFAGTPSSPGTDTGKTNNSLLVMKYLIFPMYKQTTPGDTTLMGLDYMGEAFKYSLSYVKGLISANTSGKQDVSNLYPYSSLAGGATTYPSTPAIKRREDSLHALTVGSVALDTLAKTLTITNNNGVQVVQNLSTQWAWWSDTGRGARSIVTGYALNKVRDSIMSQVYTKTAADAKYQLITNLYTNADLASDDSHYPSAPAVSAYVGNQTIVTTAPITGGGSIKDGINLRVSSAAADGTTKGVATFEPADFNDNGSGKISIDYANGQKVSGSVPGFLSSDNYTTFRAAATTGSFSASTRVATFTRIDGTTFTINLGTIDTAAILWHTLALRTGVDGSASSPALSFGDNNGFYKVSSGIIGITTSGTSTGIQIMNNVIRGNTNGNLSMNFGNASDNNVIYSYRGDLNTGMWGNGNDTAWMVNNGVKTVYTTLDNNVGIGGYPGISTQLGLYSTTKGFRIMNMTSAQKSAIASPLPGMIIYQTDGTPGLKLYTNSIWRDIWNHEITTAASTTWDVSLYPIKEYTISSNGISINITNVQTGVAYYILITQGGSGSYNTKFQLEGTDIASANMFFPGGNGGTNVIDLTDPVGSKDLVCLLYDGTNWIANIQYNLKP